MFLRMMDRYGQLLVANGATQLAVVVLGLGLFVGLGVLVAREKVSARLVWGLGLGGIVLAALVGAVAQASVVDDAFVSFRYVNNLLSGHGLVWNLDERVEGYTNLLWVLLLAALGALTPFELPLLALGLNLVTFGLTLWSLARAEARISPAAWALPLAPLLLAGQAVSLEHATTGLETSLAALIVSLGLWMLSAPRRSPLALGAVLILGVFTRPDFALLWAAAGAALTLDAVFAQSGDLRARLRAAIEVAAPYALSALPYALVLLWRHEYYGDWVPNTYYAKSADLPYWRQGERYALTFVFGTHLWLTVPLGLFALWTALRDAALRALGLFVGLAVPLHILYVMRVGGDFMYGRFFIVLLPIWMLLLTVGVARLEGRWRFAALALTLLTTRGVPIIGPEVVRWNITTEGAVYPVTAWWPKVVIDHHNWRAAQSLASLNARGVSPILATSGIGMVGYYSELPLIDLRGLTDRHTARLPVGKRGIPGHEKWPSHQYLAERGVVLARFVSAHPERWRSLTLVDLGPGVPLEWGFFQYDRALAERLRAEAPEVRFFDPSIHLDAWLKRSHRLTDEEVLRDVAFFRFYLLERNPDPARAAQLDAVLAGRGLRLDPPTDGDPYRIKAPTAPAQ